MTEPILILGTGALACLFAAKLSSKGIPVTMLGSWKEGLAALRLHGVMLVQPDGRQTAYPVKIIDNSSDCVGAKYALVLVKSWQTKRAAEQLKNCLSKDGVALTLQNGLGNREILEEALGKERVALGVTTTGATLLSSGRVRQAGEGLISIGEHARLKPILKLLKKAGFNLKTLKKVDTVIWSKLVVNAAINPITALLKISNGALLTRDSARQLSADLANEVAQVAAALQIELSFDDPTAAAESVAEVTANNHSSMYQDIKRGAPTEINAICGKVVQIGKELGVDTPVNYSLWKLINAIIEGLPVEKA
jgi:2-dehydropantoate 2-reductase